MWKTFIHQQHKSQNINTTPELICLDVCWNVGITKSKFVLFCLRMSKQTPCVNKQCAALKENHFKWLICSSWTHNEPTECVFHLIGEAGVKWKHSCGSDRQNCRLWAQTNPGAEYTPSDFY